MKKLSPNSSFDTSITRREMLSMTAVGATGLILSTAPQALGSEQAGVLIDSLNRSVKLPQNITKVVPVGMPAQAFMTTLCPEKLASLVRKIPQEDIADYADAGITNVVHLCETGGNSDSTTENLSIGKVEKLNPCIMLDAGLKKAGLKEKLDILQEQANTPCLFVDLSFGSLPESYRKLGAILECSQRAEQLANWVEEALQKCTSLSTKETKETRVFYAPREKGTLVKHSIKVQLDAISHVGYTPVTSPYDYDNGTVNMSILVAEDPDFIIFDDAKIHTSLVAESGDTFELWRDIRAIRECRYAASPALMHSWFGSILFAQAIGALWLPSVISPSICPYSILEEAQSFYELFYNLERDSSSLNLLEGLR